MNEVQWAKAADDRSVADFIAAAIASRTGARLAVPGGNTPRPILARLAAMDLPWGGVMVTLTDDRDVPPDHPASNFGALKAALGATGARLEPLREGDAPGRFDLVWVGMGEDGHVASLFPNMDVPAAAPLAVIKGTPDPLPPEAPFPRLSLNFAALTDADRLILVVRGREKKRILEDAIARRNDLPIARLLSTATCPITLFWSEG